jgi:8-oxo-dGTP diphosphatase
MPDEKMFEEFTGAKIALICDDMVLTYLRDDKPTISFPNFWDFAGGCREGDESPEQCAIRETHEEFAITIAPTQIVCKLRYENATTPGKHNYFMVARITKAEIASINFGDEGQRWQLMDVTAFLNHPQAVPQLQHRLATYLAENGKVSG